MKFNEYSREDLADGTIEITVGFAEDELADAKVQAMELLRQSANIDLSVCNDPNQLRRRLDEVFGMERVVGFIGEFCKNYVANALVSESGVYPLGRPSAVEIDPDGSAPSKEIRMRVDIRPMPQYELTSYDAPVLPSKVKKDLEAKAKFVHEASLHTLAGEIETEHFEVALNEETERFFADIENRGMSVDDFCKKKRIDEMTLRNALAKNAYENFTESMVLDAIYRHHDLQFADDDVRQVLTRLEPDDPDAVKGLMTRSMLYYQIELAAERQCARRWLMENATYVD